MAGTSTKYASPGSRGGKEAPNKKQQSSPNRKHFKGWQKRELPKDNVYVIRTLGGFILCWVMKALHPEKASYVHPLHLIVRNGEADDMDTQLILSRRICQARNEPQLSDGFHVRMMVRILDDVDECTRITADTWGEAITDVRGNLVGLVLFLPNLSLLISQSISNSVSLCLSLLLSTHRNLIA